MAKRYYLSNIIGDGTDSDPTPTTGPFRVAIADLGVSFVAQIPTDPVTGRPTKTWALALVNTDNHARLINTPGVDALPDFPLDGKVSAVNNITKTKMLASMTRRGIDKGFVDGTDGYRDVIRGIGKQVDQSFDENNFDVN